MAPFKETGNRLSQGREQTHCLSVGPLILFGKKKQTQICMYYLFSLSLFLFFIFFEAGYPVSQVGLELTL